MFVLNFKILDAVVSEKSLTQISLCITLEWEMEKGKKKWQDISALWFSFTQDTSTVCRCLQNLKTLAVLGAEKFVTKIYWRKRNNDK